MYYAFVDCYIYVYGNVCAYIQRQGGLDSHFPRDIEALLRSKEHSTVSPDEVKSEYN